MSEQPGEYVPPAAAAQRASDEWSAIHDLLAQAKGRADALSPAAEAALDGAFVRPAAYRTLLAQLLDDADAARVEATSRVDAELRKEQDHGA